MLFLHDSSLIAIFVTAKDKIVTMARPISAETANKVTLHINGGYRYDRTSPKVTVCRSMFAKFNKKADGVFHNSPSYLTTMNITFILWLQVFYCNC